MKPIGHCQNYRCVTIHENIAESAALFLHAEDVFLSEVLWFPGH